MKQILLAAAAGTILAACVNVTTTEVAEDADTATTEVAETVEETVEEVIEVAEETMPGLCLDAGPQTPRDISSAIGLNAVTFPKAPPASAMNLCNIHTHTHVHP